MTDDLKALRRGVTTLTIIALFGVAYFARDLILPVLVGLLIALTLSPVNRSLQRVGFPAAISATVLILAATAAIAAAVYFAGETARSWTDDVPKIARDLQWKLSGVTKALDAVQNASSQVEEMTSTPAAESKTAIVQKPGLLNTLMTIAASTFTSIGVALILALFLLASGDLFYVKLVQAFPTMREKKRALVTVYGIERRVSGYLFIITLINAGLGVMVALALWMLGLEYAYIWGIAAFLLNYLPILGGLVGTVLVGVHSVIFFDTVSYALLAPLAYQFLTSTEAQFVTPYLVGKRMKLNIVAVFLTVVLWGWLWGISGALVAVPFLLVFKVLCENIPSLEVAGNFLGVADDDNASQPE